ncbi:MAG: glycosyltransferase family 4 protein [Opitutales bacterium]
MKLAFITPGTGNYYCGVCMRDNSLARHLRELGHDVFVLPMYLPRFLDEEPVHEDSPIFFGGINVYLQYKFSLFRHTPAWMDRFFDSKWLLRKAAARSNMTDGKELGEITLAMFKGEDGPIAKEVGKVVDWFRKHEKPDAVLLSTILLSGLGRVVRRKLDIPVFGFLQGEDSFLDSLPDDYSEQAWDLLSKDVAELDACIAPSRYFSQEMSKRLKIPEKKLHLLPNGISLDGYSPRDAPAAIPCMGFLARLCPLKGLDVFVDAYLEIMQRGNHPELELRVAGGMTKEDEPYLNEQKKKLDAAGLLDKATFLPNVDREEKLTFLRDLTVFSVPARFPEAFGLYVVEALAAGVPVVLPEEGAFPEIVESTGGGLLYKPNEPGALADALEDLLSRPREAHAMGCRGHDAVVERFSNERLAIELIDNVLAQTPAIA